MYNNNILKKYLFLKPTAYKVELFTRMKISAT